MKLLKQILLIIWCSFLLQHAAAQPVMLKGGAIIYGIGFVLDGGIEVKLKKQFGLQFSVTKSVFRGEGKNFEKILVSPQLRYYLKKNSWQKSPYLGVVFQNNSGTTGDEIYISGQAPFGWKTTGYNKFGLGFMLGGHGKIYKKLGFDIHVGGIGEIGKVDVKKEYWPNAPPNTPNSYYTEKNKTSARPFLTFNLYLILGESTKTEKIIKNTEGSF